MSPQATRRRPAQAVVVVVGLAAVAFGLAGCMNADATAVYQEVNAQRTANGVAALPEHGGLTGRAQTWAQQLATEQRLHHADPGWYSATGCTYIGENAAVAANRDWIVPMWMGSTVHRTNIVNPAFTATGVGSYQDDNGIYWVVQVFAQCPPAS